MMTGIMNNLSVSSGILLGNFVMYCVCKYCRYNHSLSELAQRFSVSVSALIQIRNKIQKNTSSKVQGIVKQIEDKIRKT